MKTKRIKTEKIFKIIFIRTLTLGYLNPALNNSAQVAMYVVPALLGTDLNNRKRFLVRCLPNTVPQPVKDGH